MNKHSLGLADSMYSSKVKVKTEFTFKIRLENSTKLQLLISQQVLIEDSKKVNTTALKSSIIVAQKQMLDYLHGYKV